MSQINWRDPQEPKILHHQEEGGGKIIYTKNASPKRKVRGRKKRIIKALLLLALWLILLIGITAIAALAWISKDLPSADGVLKRNISVSTKIYDRTGQTVLYDIHGDIKRTLITLNDVPGYAKEAVLTAEDRLFYQHR